MDGRKVELNLVSAMLGTLILIMAYTTIVLQTFSWMLLALITLTSLLLLALLRSERETFWRSQGTIRRLYIGSLTGGFVAAGASAIRDYFVLGDVDLLNFGLRLAVWMFGTTIAAVVLGLGSRPE